ncbi:MAG: hypothetical protein KF760_09660 [Candidatus Eremiobacteraeota bacterium]|nr:hypothetical protein [Candidatus Eremiobacteraeota bacterium]MCW5866296.1 hypothetical protein [Candidatus Eremiobacteraeota bacterium]
MKLQPSRPALVPLPLAKPPEKPTPEHQQEGWWHEVGLGGLLQEKLHLTPERINSTVESARDLGKTVAISWPNLRSQVEKVMGHPLLDGRFPQAGDHIEGAVMYSAGALGYGMAGIEGLAGAARIISGVRHGNKSRILEGALDLTSGAAIAATIMGTGSLPLILGPIAGGLGIARSAVRAVKAYQQARPAEEVQAFMDGTRSAAVMATLIGYTHPGARIFAQILGPVAAVVQGSRGYVSLSQGLKKDDQARQVAGLADLGTAVGLTLTFNGLMVPGMAVTVASSAIHLAYKVLPRFEKATNATLDFFNVPMKVGMGAVDSVVDPIFSNLRKWIDTHSPWQHGEEKPPDPK